jgi:hypothetical protein
MQVWAEQKSPVLPVLLVSVVLVRSPVLPVLPVSAAGVPVPVFPVLVDEHADSPLVASTTMSTRPNWPALEQAAALNPIIFLGM